MTDPKSSSRTAPSDRRLRAIVIRARRHALIGALLVLVLCKGVIWASIVPPFQHPDDPDHVVYADRLAHDADLQLRDDTYSQAVQDAVILTGAATAFGDPLVVVPVWAGNPDAIRARVAGESRTRAWVAGASVDGAPAAAGGRTRAGSYPPLYYGAIAAGARGVTFGADTDVFTDLYTGRVLSALMTTAAVAFAWAAFGLLFASPAVRLAATGVLALLPMYSFSGSSVNPDVLVGLLTMVLLWLSMLVIRSGINLRVALAIGTCAGMGMLTKQSFAFTVVGLGVLAVLELARRRGGRRRVLAYVAVSLAMLAAVSVPFYLFATRVGAVNSVFVAAADPLSFGDYLKWARETRWLNIINEWWGVYGWLDTPVSQGWYRSLRALTFAGVALLGLGLGARIVSMRRVDPALLLVLAWPVCWFVGLTFVEYKLMASGQAPTGFIQGRYYMPIAPLLVALLVAGWMQPAPLVGRWRAPVEAVVAAVAIPTFLVYQVVALVQFVIPRFYL